MDPYSMERWILERHEAVVRTAEMRSRTAGVEAAPRGLSVWLAGTLRHLADRLDKQVGDRSDAQSRFENAPQ
jgi:hypothetical protein